VSEEGDTHDATDRWQDRGGGGGRVRGRLERRGKVDWGGERWERGRKRKKDGSQVKTRVPE
jgi:hypothetical protein